MKKQLRFILWAVLFTVLVMAALYMFRLLPGQGPAPSTGGGPGESPEEPRVIDLYFADADGRRLALEAREIAPQSLEQSISQAVRELIGGPRKESLSPTVPEGVEVRSVYFSGGVAYVDLTPDISSKHTGGSWSELLTVYSIINTITGNFSEVSRVQLLLGGNEHETLAGHIDISRPLPGRVQLLAGDW